MTGRGPVGVGIIGAGVIAEQYLTNLTAFPDTTVLAIGDLRPQAARDRAEQFAVPAHGDVDVVLDDPDIEIVLNLTIPAAHHRVSRRIIEAGKHVWSEKPLTTTREDAQDLLALAAAHGLRIGGAPDTVLGAGVQSALRAAAEGAIGTLTASHAAFRSCGPEAWHPGPEFLFQRGAGPLLDMGPYYLTTLVLAHGPVAAVSAVGTRARAQRVIGSGPRAGESFTVEVPTQVDALLRFTSGAVAACEFSFDAAADRPHELTLSGAEGAIDLPDPNTHDGAHTVRLRGGVSTERTPVGPTTGRGLGVLDMARALRAGTPHRLTGELAAHVLDVMLSIDEAVTAEAWIRPATTVGPIAPLPADTEPYAATL